MEGAEPGGRVLDVLPVLAGSALAPPLEDPVSVYTIYMYVLFLVLYGPCPLSGRPHKSSPRALLPGFLMRWGEGEGEGGILEVPHLFLVLPRI